MAADGASWKQAWGCGRLKERVQCCRPRECTGPCPRNVVVRSSLWGEVSAKCLICERKLKALAVVGIAALGRKPRHSDGNKQNVVEFAQVKKELAELKASLNWL